MNKAHRNETTMKPPAGSSRWFWVLLTCAWIAVAPLIAIAAESVISDTGNEKEELAMTALEGLMSAPPERALPLLQKVLQGQHSDRVKGRALFVLSQIDGQQAQALLIDAARNSSGELQEEAIRAIGIGGNAAALAELSSIYQSGDGQVRKAVLQAWMIADREEEIFQVAMQASDEAEAAEAIQLLGALGARDALRKLGAAGKGSRSLIQAYAIADDLEALVALYDSSGEESLRVEAVQAIGIIDGDQARASLRRIYAQTDSPQIREAALQGMLIADDEQGVLELYKASNDPEQKRALLRTLTLIGGDAAIEAIDAALEGRQP